VGLAVAAPVALGDVDGGVEAERAGGHRRQQRARAADADGRVAASGSYSASQSGGAPGGAGASPKRS
jgi:hypothetical protein